VLPQLQLWTNTALTHATPANSKWHCIGWSISCIHHMWRISFPSISLGLSASKFSLIAAQCLGCRAAICCPSVSKCTALHHFMVPWRGDVTLPTEDGYISFCEKSKGNASHFCKTKYIWESTKGSWLSIMSSDSIERIIEACMLSCLQFVCN